jgi:G3E family GTPase
MSRRIPVVLVAGYLGAGKTTLLNHLLSNNRGLRIGVVVNDFGAVNIDAMTVAGQVDSLVSLGNGCLCCAVDASGLDNLLGRLTRPRTGLDLIVIEASGLAEPRDLVRLVLSSEHSRIEYGGLIEVVDAVEFEAARARHPELDQHVAFADLVVLNKTDRLDEASLHRTRTLIEKISEGRPVLPTSQGRVDLDLLTDPGNKRPASAQMSFEDLVHDEDCDHPHAAYESVEFVSEQPLNPRRLMRFLDGRPDGLYRAKGIVYFGLKGHRHKFTLHTVGRYLRFHRSHWPAGEPRTTSLVLIGTGLDTGRLRAELEQCVEPDPASVDQNAMLRVLRHIP